MSIQIALEWSKDCEKELIAMGFEKRTVYTKQAPFGMTKDSNDKGDDEFFGMINRPFQFITASWWGAGPG